MKRLVHLCLILISTSCLAGTTLAVLPVQSVGDHIEATETYEVLTHSLAKTNRFTLVERDQLSKILDELKLQNSGIVDENTAVNIGKQSGAQIAALGTLRATMSREYSDRYNRTGYKIGVDVYFRTRLTLDVRFVDVQSGIITTSLQIKASGFQSSQAGAHKSAIDDLQVKLERELGNKFPLTGYVIKSNSDSEYIIDLGEASGVAVDDKFVLFTEGEDIVHPVTGKIIKGEKNIVGDGVVTRVQNEVSFIKASHLNGVIIPGKVKIESKPKTKGLWESFKDIGN